MRVFFIEKKTCYSIVRRLNSEQWSAWTSVY